MSKNGVLQIGSILFEIIGLALLALTLFLGSHKWVVFNSSFLEIPGLKFLYYLMPNVFCTLLIITWLYCFKRRVVFLSRLIVVLIIVYGCIVGQQLLFKFCDPQKNLNGLHLAVQWMFFILNVALGVFRILPKLSKKSIVIIGLTVVLIFLDLHLLWLSYSVYLKILGI